MSQSSYNSVHSHFLQSISDLRDAIATGDRDGMHKKALQLDRLHSKYISNPLENYESALAYFEYAKVKIDYYIKVDEISQAVNLRNEITTDYQLLRKEKDYTAQQKHTLKIILQEIKEQTNNCSALAKSKYDIDKTLDKYKRDIFESRAYGWFAEVHGMLPQESLDYLRPFGITQLLHKLPLDMPKRQVVEEITKFCYEKGGRLAPRSLQRHYAVSGHPAKHLYVIGNGFDRYHGAKSGYNSFRSYLYKQAPDIVGCFDLYFGPRSLENSFSTPDGWWWCMQPYEYRHDVCGLKYPVATWSRSNLWCDFEANLCELNREKVFDLLDMQLPRVDEGEPGFHYSAYYKPLDDIANVVQSCTFEMKYHFHKWINTLHYAKGFRKNMLDIDKDAVFLNFNYTLFLESEYGIPAENICYIHGNRKDKYGSLVLGHHAADKESYEQWKHKNKNRRRYRDVQKDNKGHYFKNDKLVYLAFFAKNREQGNWRLPIRYYAIDAAEERLERYYDENYKNTRKIIDSHMGFFDSLNEVEKVTVIGCSMSPVDMDYFKQLKISVKNYAIWEFSYHSDSDLKRINKFCNELSIKNSNALTFAL